MPSIPRYSFIFRSAPFLGLLVLHVLCMCTETEVGFLVIQFISVYVIYLPVWIPTKDHMVHELLFLYLPTFARKVSPGVSAVEIPAVFY